MDARFSWYFVGRWGMEWELGSFFLVNFLGAFFEFKSFFNDF
jgi:hypothetical protein